MTAKKPVKNIIAFAILLSIPLVVFFSCKMLINTKENPEEWIGNNDWVAFTSVYGSTAHKNYITSVMPTKDGGYIPAGNIVENRTFTMNIRATYRKTVGGSDSWLIKADAAGKKIWERPIWGEGHNNVASAQQTKDGGYILAGHTDSGDGYTDGWLVKADGEGNQLWSQAYSSGGIDIINYVIESQDGGYILAGWSNFPNDERYNDGWLIKTDAQGKEIWSCNFGDSKDDLIYSMAETGDGGYILVGETISPVNGSYDGWLIKLNPDGQVLWSKSFGGHLQDVFFSVSTTMIPVSETHYTKR